jgi:phage/plasmid-associated DNA primase
MKKVEAYMKSKEVNLPSEEKYNLVFHVAMYVTLVMMGRSNYQPKDIVKIDPDEITPDILAYCLKQVISVFHRLSKESNRPLDVLAKNREATNALLKWFDKTFKREDIMVTTVKQGDNE